MPSPESRPPSARKESSGELASPAATWTEQESPMSLIRRLWARVNEPRIVSVSHALVYFVLLSAGLYALVNPPTTLEGAAGACSRRLLAGTLAIGGALGGAAGAARR